MLDIRGAISGADSIGYGGTSPHFYKWLGTGGTVSRRIANKKLTKLYCTIIIILVKLMVLLLREFLTIVQLVVCNRLIFRENV